MLCSWESPGDEDAKQLLELLCSLLMFLGSITIKSLSKTRQHRGEKKASRVVVENAQARNQGAMSSSARVRGEDGWVHLQGGRGLWANTCYATIAHGEKLRIRGVSIITTEVIVGPVRQIRYVQVGGGQYWW